jgi:hypothetical protein
LLLLGLRGICRDAVVHAVIGCAIHSGHAALDQGGQLESPADLVHDFVAL